MLPNGPPRVLLFIAHFGDGHRQAATALRLEFERRGAVVEEVDCLRSAHPMLSKLSEFTFEFLTRHAPVVYGWSHEWTRNVPNESWFWRALSSGPHRAAHQAIAEQHPDIVLQLFPEHTLTNLSDIYQSEARLREKQQSETQMPESLLLGTGIRPVTGVVLTDFSIHSRWFCPEAQVYYLPHESMLPAARRQVKSAEENRFVVSGIPIRPEFSAKVPLPTQAQAADDDATDAATDAEASRATEAEAGRGTDCAEQTRTHILVATGGRGVFPDLERTLEAIRRQSLGLPVYVLCGRNEQMYRKVEEIAGRTANGASVSILKPLPFQKDVASLLKGAVYAVVKAGGVTVAECLSSACPMIFYRPAPGQERDNAAWVESQGAGRIVHTSKDVEAAATEFNNPAVARQFRETAKALSHSDAATRIVEDTMSRWRERSRGVR